MNEVLNAPSNLANYFLRKWKITKVGKPSPDEANIGDTFEFREVDDAGRGRRIACVSNGPMGDIKYQWESAVFRYDSGYRPDGNHGHPRLVSLLSIPGKILVVELFRDAPGPNGDTILCSYHAYAHDHAKPGALNLEPLVTDQGYWHGDDGNR